MKEYKEAKNEKKKEFDQICIRLGVTGEDVDAMAPKFLSLVEDLSECADKGEESFILQKFVEDNGNTALTHFTILGAISVVREFSMFDLSNSLQQ